MLSYRLDDLSSFHLDQRELRLVDQRFRGFGFRVLGFELRVQGLEVRISGWG